MSSPLERLRQAMQTAQVDAFIVPSEDPHRSEYVAEHWQSRAWLSGFTGSAGTVMVTAQHAGLWTDSRYYLQVEKTFAGSPWHLHRSDQPSFIDWAIAHLPKGSRVGYDATLHSLDETVKWGKKLEMSGLVLTPANDIIAKAWTERPALPKNHIFDMPVALAGESRAAKLKRLRHQMSKLDCSHHLVSTLDDIAWILNIRGSDVECNPVAIAYLLIGERVAYLCIDPQKVPADLLAALQKDKIEVHPYTDIELLLSQLKAKDRLLADTSVINAAMMAFVPLHTPVQASENPSILMKAVKNKTECKHIRRVMEKDGVAMVRFLRWLEAEVPKGTATEYSVGEALLRFRAEQPDFVGESFSAIVGYRDNGAVVHYRAEKASAHKLDTKGILLIDSGGQYLDGTTDITRTVALGAATNQQKHHYTLVLKGHIALAMARFPNGTRGAQLDTLARMPLWQEGLNYGHGTGHGVGFFLNVHEPPQGFRSDNHSRTFTPHEPGMLSSNEPGFYQAGEYGIRIENLILCVEESVSNGYGTFCSFETVTLCPIDTTLIDLKLMNKEEKTWLNRYHQTVFRRLSKYLSEDDQQWLKLKCERI